MKKRMCKVVAMMCSVALLMQFSAVAMTEETHLILDNQPPAAEETLSPEELEQLGEEMREAFGVETEPVLLGEDPERREENVKHFLRSDGAYTAVYYNEPMDDGSATFYSGRNPSQAEYAYKKPVVQISYRDTKGVEGYWTHHDQSVGRAGTGIINDMSGRLVFQHVDGATSGNVMPASVSHFYNALQAGEEYLPGFSGVEAYPQTGLGWKLNVQQTMYKIPASDPLYETGYRYIYTDADGTQHYFYLNGNNEIVDEDGLDLTLTETGGWQNGPKMTFRDGSYMTFSAEGRGYMVETYNASGDKMRYLHNHSGRYYIGDAHR